jgi:signal transduction histidine kinase
MNPLLHDFIVTNRDQIIAKAISRVQSRTAPSSGQASTHGVPLFLSQLAEALESAASGAPATGVPAGAQGPFGPSYSRKRIMDSATLHGQALLKSGFTVAQVVHGYGDVCQIVTELASELKVSISAEEFQVFNRCLDDAIAGAVTAYARQREEDLVYEGTERFGVLVHEVRNLLNTAILSFDAIKRGTVGTSGSTGAVHARSLAKLRALVDRSVSEVRLETGEPLLTPLSLAEFIEEVEVGAAMLAEGYGIHFTTKPVDGEIWLEVDRQLLSSALVNLLQNAFKFSRTDGNVMLATTATAERVQISVSDECGGLPKEKREKLFQPFTRASDNSSGLGLGLSIAMSAVKANLGEIQVMDRPGHGCVFTIDLPRHQR